MIPFIMILATIGFSISLYAYWVENKIKNEPEYKPACDLSDQISCSKPMLSQYANIFYFSNALWGIIAYTVIFLLAYFNMIQPLLVVAICMCIVSIILGYLLYFKIKSLCIVCTSLYIVNFLILSSIIYYFYL